MKVQMKDLDPKLIRMFHKAWAKACLRMIIQAGLVCVALGYFFGWDGQATLHTFGWISLGLCIGAYALGVWSVFRPGRSLR